MITYKKVPKIQETDIEFVLKIPDMKYVPIDFDNLDYRDYLKWCEEGNTPEPADDVGSDYRVKRAAEYPSIGDQLDALFHAGMLPQELTIQIQAIKARYPKV
jgi:hypothetical protein